MAPLSMLNGHPDRKKVPGVETNTGPLGHGFPVAVGCALAARLQRRVVAHVRRARRRRAAGGQQLGGGDDRRPLRASTRSPRSSTATACSRARGPRRPSGSSRSPTSGASFGWEVREVDGHDHGALLDAFAPSTTGKPVAVIANTIKGKGVSFIEDRVEWHHKVPDAEQVAGRARGAHAMTVPARAGRPDLRLPQGVRRGADRAGRARTSAIVAVCNDSVGSSNLVGFREEFPDRLINVGIAEQDLVGVGAGLANGGLIPFVSAAAPFLTGRALEQIKADAAYSDVPRRAVRPEPRHGLRRARADAPLDRGPVVDARDRRTSTVVVPADPAQTRAAVRWAAATAGPVLHARSRASRSPTSPRTARRSSPAAPSG